MTLVDKVRTTTVLVGLAYFMVGWFAGPLWPVYAVGLVLGTLGTFVVLQGGTE